MSFKVSGQISGGPLLTMECKPLLVWNMIIGLLTQDLKEQELSFASLMNRLSSEWTNGLMKQMDTWDPGSLKSMLFFFANDHSSQTRRLFLLPRKKPAVAGGSIRSPVPFVPLIS